MALIKKPRHSTQVVEDAKEIPSEFAPRDGDVEIVTGKAESAPIESDEKVAEESVTAAFIKPTSEAKISHNPHDIPTEFTLRDFESEQSLIRHKVSEVITLVELGEVDSKSISRLLKVLEIHQDVDFDEDYDMRDELQTMMKMVRAVRSSILTSDNQIAKNTTVTEVKAVLDASMRLTQLLTKSNKEIINMDRIRAVEASFLEVISEMPTEMQKAYVDTLEHRMTLMKELSQLVD